MRYLARRLLPALALFFASFVCGAQERQAEAPGVVPAPVETSAGVPSADLRLKLNLHIFGLSYHTDREGSRVSHIDNELNYGLGLNHEFYGDDRGVAIVEVGFFKDSGSNWAKFAGVGYQFKLDDRWRVGGDLLVLHSETYNNGSTFIAPIPRLTYDIGKPGVVRLNAIYIPKISDINLYAVFALYLTVQLGHW